MIWVALGAGMLVLGLAVLRLFATAPVVAVKRVAVWSLAALGAVLAVVLLVSGRAGQVVWLAALFGPAAWRAYRGWRASRQFGRPAPGGESAVRTAMLAMRLDHDSGAMHGEVLAGRFAGRDLASLTMVEARALLAEAQAADAESVPLLEAWLDREMPGWREAAGATAPDGGPMRRAEALALLGLAEGADAAAIRAAHRRLMQAAHPDRGGSAWLAARLNEARDVLLS